MRSSVLQYCADMRPLAIKYAASERTKATAVIYINIYIYGLMLSIWLFRAAAIYLVRYQRYIDISYLLCPLTSAGLLKLISYKWSSKLKILCARLIAINSMQAVVGLRTLHGHTHYTSINTIRWRHIKQRWPKRCTERSEPLGRTFPCFNLGLESHYYFALRLYRSLQVSVRYLTRSRILG